jgi:hypothetical protein
MAELHGGASAETADRQRAAAVVRDLFEYVMRRFGQSSAID